VASGLLSLGFGLFLAYQIGVVDGLFTTDPRWTPE
jgi:high-affinity nickel-transport protein